MTTGTNKEEKFLLLLTQFMTAFNKAKEARALCYLIEEISLGTMIVRYTDILDEAYKHYGEHKLQFDWRFIDANGDVRAKVRNEILDLKAPSAIERDSAGLRVLKPAPYKAFSAITLR